MPGIIWLASYPKSGNTWLRAFLANYLSNPAKPLPINDLLYRLFHAERVRVFEPRPLKGGCRCSQERIERVLASIPREEIDEMKVDGLVTVTCQFCNVEYRFRDSDLDRIYQS